MLAAFSSLAMLTFLSRISGFARVALFAAFYGGTREADLFLAVMILPELLYRLISEGLVSSAAVPIFVREAEETPHRSAACGILFWGVTVLGTILVVGLWTGAPWICAAVVPGFPALVKSRMVFLWRLIAPYVLFALQAALLTAFLNARKQFAAPALGPLLVNGAIILGIVIQSGGAVERIGLSVSVGGFLQVLYLLWLARRSGACLVRPNPAGSTSPKRLLGEFMRNAAPVAGWLLCLPLIPVYERFLLSSQPVGSVAILSYTEKIMNLPLGIVAISLARSVFPFLSAAPWAERTHLFRRALWGAVCMLIPLTLMINGAAEEVVTIVLQRGKFQTAEVAMTVRLLQASCWALFPMALIMILNRMYFAQQRNRIPFFIGLTVIVLQFGLDTLLVERIGASGGGGGLALAAGGHAPLAMWFLPTTSARIAIAHGWRPILSGALLLVGLAWPVRMLCRQVVAAVGPHATGLRLAALFACWAVLQLLFLGLGKRQWHPGEPSSASEEAPVAPQTRSQDNHQGA